MNQNPILKRAAQGNAGYGSFNSPVFSGASGQVGALSSVMNKAAAQFAVVIAVAIASAAFMPAQYLTPALLASGLLAMGLAFAMAFMKTVPVPLIFLYGAIEGVFVGTVSVAYSAMYDGVVPTAIVATTATAAAIILGVKVNLIKTTSKARKIFGYALIGYLVFSLIALGAALLGHPILQFGSPLLLAVSIFGTFMASFSFVTSVEDVKNLSSGADKNMQWRLAFGLVVSLIWLYVEMLRLVASITSLSRD